MQDALKPLGRPALLHHSVQDAIKSYIVSNELRPGDPLPSEVQLGRSLDVSRNSVREAVKVLESQGVLEIRRGTGLFVGNFSFGSLLSHLEFGLRFELRELVDLIQVRRILERGMIDIALERIDEDQIRRLRELVEQMRLKAERSESYLEEDRAFHQLLAEPLQNPVFIKLMDVFWLAYSKATEKYGDINHPELDRIHRNHVDILEAVAARDSQAAYRTLDRHYDVAESFLTETQHRLESST